MTDPPVWSVESEVESDRKSDPICESSDEARDEVFAMYEGVQEWSWNVRKRVSLCC